MDPPGLEAILSQFGIKRQPHGRENYGWTIDIVSDEAESRTQVAYFDEHLGQWRLPRASEKYPSSQPGTGEVAVDHAPSETTWINAFPTSSHITMLLESDWESTPLGALHTWDRSLQLYVQMLLSDPRPAAIYWGPQRIAIYNEACVPLIGDFHPALMGRSFEEVMPAAWEYFGPFFAALSDGQHGFAPHGLELFTTRYGYLEESWWDGCLIALKNGHGSYGGAYFSWAEATRDTLRDRRTRMLNRLGHSSLSTDRSFWQHVHDVFQEYPRDISMAIMYSMDDNDQSNQRLHREHTIGLGADHVAAPLEINVSPTVRSHVSSFRANHLAMQLISTEGHAAIASLLHRARENSTDALFIVSWLCCADYAFILTTMFVSGFIERRDLHQNARRR